MAAAFLTVYVMYPKADVQINGNAVKFDSPNSQVIEISENPDFSNSRFIEVNNSRELMLVPGTYYWRASNNFIQGFGNSFVVKSEVGLGVENQGNDSEIVNIGNVKINVTKNKEGVMIGHIILEPDEKEKLEDVNYTGRQA